MKRQSKRPASSHGSSESAEGKLALTEDEALKARNMEHDDEPAGGRAARSSACDKKRRLAAKQVCALERCFTTDTKLGPDRKSRIARDLGLQPRQVAVWFRNRRARWNTKMLERDYAALRAHNDALRANYDALRREMDTVAAEGHQSPNADNPQVKRYIEIAQVCVDDDPCKRPTIDCIINMLSENKTD